MDVVVLQVLRYREASKILENAFQTMVIMKRYVKWCYKME